MASDVATCGAPPCPVQQALRPAGAPRRSTRPRVCQCVRAHLWDAVALAVRRDLRSLAAGCLAATHTYTQVHTHPRWRRSVCTPDRIKPPSSVCAVACMHGCLRRTTQLTQTTRSTSRPTTLSPQLTARSCAVNTATRGRQRGRAGRGLEPRQTIVVDHRIADARRLVPRFAVTVGVSHFFADARYLATHDVTPACETTRGGARGRAPARSVWVWPGCCACTHIAVAAWARDAEGLPRSNCEGGAAASVHVRGQGLSAAV